MKKKEFWLNVNKTDNCWVWQGTLNNCGYGQLSMNGKTVLAHRYSWELANGQIPNNICVCHSCDTPNCVKPSHLFLGTHADNMSDCVRKGRAYRGNQRGEKNGNARLTWRIVDKIRSNVANGSKQIDEARRVGISKGRVSEIINHKVW